jgi:hypothetical protein
MDTDITVTQTGSRFAIIPKSILADRDLLMKFGFKMDEDKAVLQSPSLSPRIGELRETAYANFMDTINLWLDMGYGPDDICSLLVRIYREQTGGGRLVEEDRKERKKRLTETLGRLTSEKIESDPLHHIAISTLSVLNEFK